MFTCDPTFRLGYGTRLLAADAVWAEGVFQRLAGGHQVAKVIVGVEGEPGTVGVAFAQLEAQKLMK